MIINRFKYILDFIYKYNEKYNIKLTDQCIKDKNCYSICPTNEGDLFSNISYIDDMDNTMDIS